MNGTRPHTQLGIPVESMSRPAPESAHPEIRSPAGVGSDRSRALGERLAQKLSKGAQHPDADESSWVNGASTGNGYGAAHAPSWETSTLSDADADRLGEQIVELLERVRASDERARASDERVRITEGYARASDERALALEQQVLDVTQRLSAAALNPRTTPVPVLAATDELVRPRGSRGNLLAWTAFVLALGLLAAGYALGYAPLRESYEALLKQNHELAERHARELAAQRSGFESQRTQLEQQLAAAQSSAAAASEPAAASDKLASKPMAASTQALANLSPEERAARSEEKRAEREARREARLAKRAERAAKRAEAAWTKKSPTEDAADSADEPAAAPRAAAVKERGHAAADDEARTAPAEDTRGAAPDHGHRAGPEELHASPKSASPPAADGHDDDPLEGLDGL